MAPKKKSDKLKSLCQSAINEFQPQNNETYCNWAVNYVARGMGYDYFEGKTANLIIAHMEKSPEFAVVEPDVAKILADDGKLVIAGRRGESHGHVAVVYPGGEMVKSAKFAKEVPTVANVGRSNGVMGVNWAFDLPPKYWVWIDTKVA